MYPKLKKLKRSILYISLLIAFCVGVAINSSGQRIQGAVIGGVNLTQVDGDEIYGFNKAGLNFGASATLPFSKNFNFTIETIYSQKGAYQGKQYETHDSLGNILYTGEYRLQLDYVEVPFLIQYNDKDVFIAGGGISYGMLVNVKEYEHGNRVESTTLNSGTYKRSDLCILADLRFRLYKKLKFNLRYSYSLAKIRTRHFYDQYGNYTHTRNQYNNVVSLRLIYVFNEEPPRANPSNKNGGF